MRDSMNNTVSQLQGDVVPAGAVMYFTTPTAPSGWLIANGDVISRTTYSRLFNVIGTTFGSGDGSTTFKLPDLRGLFIRTANNSGDLNIRNNGVSEITVPRDGWGAIPGSYPSSYVAATRGRLIVASGGIEYAEALESLHSAGNDIKIQFNPTPPSVSLLACIKY